jgi:predicted ATP-grasp superfamily ATP-dependent carboligase
MYEFVTALRNIIIEKNISVLIPVSDMTIFAVLKHQSAFDDLVNLPLVSFETYWAASNKSNLIEIAKKLDIPAPATINIDPAIVDTLSKNIDKLIFPVIIKPQASIQQHGEILRKTGVRFASNREELQQIITTDTSFTTPYMLQEVISGDGIGIFAFCVKGEIISVFSHRRIREKPPYGGVSVVCESTQPNPSALESSRKLLKALNWDGVAMVEFKCDANRNNTPILMEINARFWGSLQLAIDAGVNFPMQLYNLSQKATVPNAKAILPKRSRWLLGDLDHLLIRLKMPPDHPLYPQRLVDKIGAVAIFVLEFLQGSTIEELRYGDWRPFWHSLKKWIKNV